MEYVCIKNEIEHHSTNNYSAHCVTIIIIAVKFVFPQCIFGFHLKMKTHVLSSLRNVEIRKSSSICRNY